MLCCQIRKDFSKSAAVYLRRGIPDFSETYYRYICNIACFAFPVRKPEAEVYLEFKINSLKLQQPQQLLCQLKGIGRETVSSYVNW